MAAPFVIDNQDQRQANVLNDLLAKTAGKPFDVPTAYFAVSGYRLVKNALHLVGAFRLLLGAEPHNGALDRVPLQRGSWSPPTRRSVQQRRAAVTLLGQHIIPQLRQPLK